MKEHEICVFADPVTYVNQKTIVKMFDGKEHIGHFIFTRHSSDLRKNNQWKFNVSHFEKEGNKTIILNGNDILSIEVKTIS